MRNPVSYGEKLDSVKGEYAERDKKKHARRNPMQADVASNVKADKQEPIKTSGSFEGKSNALGHGGRAAQMKAKGVPGGVIGAIARKEGAAPGGPNYHGSK